ncbi:MAG TPA: hypothetical protein VMW32_05745 [Bacteroidales bacterium]|nr:hypothetical protein [Bacteroidales bacterium]
MKISDFIKVKGKERMEEIIAVPFRDVINIAVVDDINRFVRFQLERHGASEELIKEILPERLTDGLCIDIEDEEGINMLAMIIDYKADFSVLIHEVEHIVFLLLSRKNFKHSGKTDELYAYYQQWFFAEFLRKMS